MWRYAAKRLIETIFVVLGVIFLVFVIFHIAPGDPLTVLSGGGPLSSTVESNLRHSFGLDKPLYLQYFHYVKNIFTGDLGMSFSKNRPVFEILKETFPNSARLALAAITLEAIVGIGLGLYFAVNRSKFKDVLMTVSTSLLISIPVFWLAMILQQMFGVRLKWLPVSGMGDGSIRYYILPVINLSTVFIAFVAQTMRSSMIKVMGEDYIRTARASGIPESKVIRKYALKNAISPVITLIALDLGALMGGAVATEVIFNWPGIGNQLYLAILARDRPLVMGAVLALVIIFIFINFLVDISYSYFDPKIQTGES